jgi:hypothetical protein
MANLPGMLVSRRGARRAAGMNFAGAALLPSPGCAELPELDTRAVKQAPDSSPVEFGNPSAVGAPRHPVASPSDGGWPRIPSPPILKRPCGSSDGSVTRPRRTLRWDRPQRRRALLTLPMSSLCVMARPSTVSQRARTRRVEPCGLSLTYLNRYHRPARTSRCFSRNAAVPQSESG